MLKIKLFIVGLLLILLAGFVFISEKNEGEPKVIGWIPYWDQANAIQSFDKNISKIDFVSVFWYQLDENGKVKPYTGANIDKNLIKRAQENNVKVLALVANLSETNSVWDHQRVNKVISSKEARENHIEELIKLVEDNNFDGIDIDYEALKAYQRDDFSDFIKELSFELHKRNKILGVAIHPKTSENNPLEDNGSHAQDLRKISRYADQMYFMTYLEHGAFSEPGPIGSLGWMESIMKYGLSQTSKNKAFLGIGLMGAQWGKSPNGDYEVINPEMKFLDVYNTALTNGLTPIWDENSKTPYLTFQTNGAEQIVWFENAESIRLRIDLAKKLNVEGVAFWRLGGEDDRIWEDLK